MAALLVLSCDQATSGAGQPGAIELRAATSDWGLTEPLLGMHGHAIAAGDVNNDGWEDLLIGTFADRAPQQYAKRGADGPNPDRLLFGSRTGFEPGPEVPVPMGRTAGAAFADMDNDGDLDLLLIRNAAKRSADVSYLLENTGTGEFRVKQTFGAGMGGRSVAVLDADGDARLDFVVAEDRWRGGNSRLFMNQEGTFVESTALPQGVHGLSVVAADFNNDRRPDIFVGGSNQLLVNQGGTFLEHDSASFAWERYGDEDDPAGVAIGDIDSDGALDLVVGHHYNSASEGNPVSVRVYRNRTIEHPDDLSFEDVTSQLGLVPLSTKAPHVEFVDLNNDGLLDLVASAITETGRPLVLTGARDAEGRAQFGPQNGTGVNYWICGASVDFDRDGRVDFVGVEWDPARATTAFANESTAGNWLRVRASWAERPAIGTRVEIYESGRANEPSALLATDEIASTAGNCSGRVQAAHFGLGSRTRVDVVVRAPWTGETEVVSRARVGQSVCAGTGC